MVEVVWYIYWWRDGIDYSQNPLTQMITTPDGDTMTVKEAVTNDVYTDTIKW